MDTLWAFRQAYNEARKVKEKQDEFCSKAEAGLWNGLDKEFPDSLQWEALVDVLRGKVKVSVLLAGVALILNWIFSARLMFTAMKGMVGPFPAPK
jgi:hypothetical protein